MLDDEMFADLFEGELTAEEVSDLRRALVARLAALQRARERGEPIVVDSEEIDNLRRALSILQEEELIAQFVEAGLQASVRRRRILDALGEGEEEGG